MAELNVDYPDCCEGAHGTRNNVHDTVFNIELYAETNNDMLKILPRLITSFIAAMGVCRPCKFLCRDELDVHHLSINEQGLFGNTR